MMPILFLQDAVLLMDISSSEFPSSFRMVHEQRKRYVKLLFQIYFEVDSQISDAFVAKTCFFIFAIWH